MSDVHRFLVTGNDDQLYDFHTVVAALLAALERQGQTVLYTCMSEEDRDFALEAAKATGVTVQERDSEVWEIIAGDGPGWIDPPEQQAPTVKDGLPLAANG